MKQEEKLILNTDKDIVEAVMVLRWRTDKDNRVFDTEEYARNYVATHKKCDTEDCEAIVKIGWRRCDNCTHYSYREMYNKLTYKEWDGESLLSLFDNDVFFSDIDEIHDYCEENDVNPSDLMLIICEPIALRNVELDYWEDDVPENCDGLASYRPELAKKIQELNDWIDSQPPLSWSEGRFRTKI